jgi:hypothetical protein
LSSLPEPLAREGTGCVYCDGFAEPEQDGDVVYFVCPKCEGEFGHRKVSGTFCAAGLPVLAAEPGPPVIATTIRRRPE